MRVSFKSFWGETFMALPNVNFWSDDDPEYAPHKYMLFFGWLWWGVRLYFGWQGKRGKYCVLLINNEAQGKSYYVLTPLECADSELMCLLIDYSRLFDTLLKNETPTPEQAAALFHCENVPVCGDILHDVAGFASMEDAFVVRDMLDEIAARKERDKWSFVKYRKMYMSHQGV